MKWTHVYENGKTLRTWDTKDDGLFPEIIFDAFEGNIFALVILLSIAGFFGFFILLALIVSVI